MPVQQTMKKKILDDSYTAKSLRCLLRIIGFCHFTVIKFFFFFFFSLHLSCRLQKQQQQQQQEEQTTKQTQNHPSVCVSKVMTTGTTTATLLSDNRTFNNNDKICGIKQTDNSDSNKNNKDKTDDKYESTSGESGDEASVELWSNEIPVYIKGEQRWISGVTDQTTCLDIIEALLIDEGIIKTTNDSNNNATGVNMYPTKVNEYVITERWRRMEQALDGRTKILKIWTSWGSEQSEVC